MSDAAPTTLSFWFGRSSLPVTGEQAAEFLGEMLAVLEKTGWVRHQYQTPEDKRLAEQVNSLELDIDSLGPLDLARRTVRLVLQCLRDLVTDFDERPQTLFGANLMVARTVGDSDTQDVAKRCMEAVVLARVGQSEAMTSRPDVWAWAERRGRTFDEVRDLLNQAAEFARQYGPK